jgi:hypothetical protein
MDILKIMINRILRLRVTVLALVLVASLQLSVAAAPFGEGKFGADIPFGSATSLAIALGGDVSMNLIPSGGNFTANGSHTITVTSTDPVGYKLYTRSLGSTSMTSGSNTIPASSNSSAAPLTVNSWGYNTDASSNFLGMTTVPALLKDATGPYKSGDNTTVTYGVLADITTGAGSYTTSVVYTAVAATD